MKRLAFILLLFFLLTFQGYYALLQPGLIVANDSQGHIIKQVEFDRALRDGQVPVRWAAKLNFGLGYPLFVFNYPGTYYLTHLPHLVGLSYPDAYKLILLLTFPLSGFFTYLWLRGHFTNQAAFTAGIFYSLIPYHFLNVYVRGALAESIGMTLIPLIFYLVDRLFKKTSALNSFLLTLGLMLSLTTHNVTALIYVPVWFIYGLIRYKSKFEVNYFKKLLASFLGSVLLSSFFIIPAFYYKNLTQLDSIMRGVYQDHFLTLGNLIYAPWGYTGSKVGVNQGEMSFMIGVLHLALVVFAIGLIVFKILSHQKFTETRLLIISSTLFCLSVFLMLEISTPIWNLMTPLQYLQFPWRLLSLVAITSSVLIAFLINQLSSLIKLRLLKAAFIWAIVLALFYANRNITRANSYLDWVDPLDTSGVYSTTATSDSEHLPPWHSEFEEQLPYLPYRVDSGLATITQVERQSNRHSYEIEVTEESIITDRTEYFPGWKVYVNDHEQVLVTSQDIKSKGLISFELLPGSYQVEVIFEETTVERLADLLSVLTLILFLSTITKEVLSIKL